MNELKPNYFSVSKQTALDEHAFAIKMKHALNDSAQALPQATLDKLYAARRQAVAQRKSAHSHSAGFLSGLIQKSKNVLQHTLSPLAFAVPAMVVGVGLLIFSDNNADSYVQTVAEIDSQVLTHDLPIDALLDKGFVRYVQVGE